MGNNRGYLVLAALLAAIIVVDVMGFVQRRRERHACVDAIDEARSVAFGMFIGLSMEREALEANPERQLLDPEFVDYYRSQVDDVLGRLLDAGDACGAPQLPDGCEAVLTRFEDHVEQDVVCPSRLDSWWFRFQQWTGGW